MWKFIKENFGGLFIGALILGFVGMLIIDGINARKQRVICLASVPSTQEFKLVSLFDYQYVIKESSLSGGFFLMMGAVRGSSIEDLKYYIRYAYEDSYGVKLMTEEIENDSKIRIKEVKDSQPRVIIKNKKTFWTTSTPKCQEEEIMRIFEIPEGTVYKTFELDMK